VDEDVRDLTYSSWFEYSQVE
jgi:chromobox protein 1